MEAVLMEKDFKWVPEVEPIAEIPSDVFEKQLVLTFTEEDNKQMVGIHDKFVLTHPKSKERVCGHLISGNTAAMAGRTFCLRKAGAGTEHPGEGYCSYHGKVSIIKSGGSGRYSKYLKGVLSDRLENFMQDPEILSLNDEIALLRAVLSELISMKETIEQQMIDVRKSYDIEIALVATPADLSKLQAERDEKTRKLIREYRDLIEAIQSGIERIAKIVETKNKIENGEKYTISIEMIKIVVIQILHIVKKYIKDPETLFQLGKDLSNLRLPNEKEDK